MRRVVAERVVEARLQVERGAIRMSWSEILGSSKYLSDSSGYKVGKDKSRTRNHPLMCFGKV